MVDESLQRGISAEFEEQFTSGILLPLLERVRHDDTLSLEIRNGHVSIYYRGDKYYRSWGTTISVDAFDILGTPVVADPAPPVLFTNRYEQSDSRITYLGSWDYTSKWQASGGSLSSTIQTGAAAVIQFTGTDITVLGRTTSWYGMARVTLDGVEQDPADFYSAVSLYKQPVIRLTGLANESHTLTIECTGEKNPASSGYRINLDALDITGAINQAQSLTRFQQDDPSCVYSGTWQTGYTSYYYASGGSLVSTNTEGASVTITFEGSYAILVSKTTPWYGIAEVSVDGGAAVEVDLWSSTQKYKQRVFSTGILTPGSHTLTITWTGNKNPSSWGTTIGLDAVDVLVTAE